MPPANIFDLKEGSLTKFLAHEAGERICLLHSESCCEVSRKRLGDNVLQAIVNHTNLVSIERMSQKKNAWSHEAIYAMNDQHKKEGSQFCRNACCLSLINLYQFETFSLPYTALRVFKQSDNQRVLRMFHIFFFVFIIDQL